MNPVYLINRTYRWLAISATFVHVHATLDVPAPPAALPEGSISLQIPSAQYRPNRTYVVRPQIPDEVAPPAEPDELIASRRAFVQGYSPPYRKPWITAASPQLQEPEETITRRSISIPKQTYRPPPLTTQAPQLDNPVVEYDERIQSRTSINLKTYPYAGKTTITPPPIGADVASTGLPEGGITLQVPSALYRPQTTTYRNGVPVDGVVPPEAEEVHRRIAVWYPPQPYKRPHIVAVQPYREHDLPEADQCLIIVTDYPDHSGLTRITPPVTVADVVIPTDELLSSRRVIVPAPARKYGSWLWVDRDALHRPDVEDDQGEDEQGGHSRPPRGRRKARVVPNWVLDYSQLPERPPEGTTTQPVEVLSGTEAKEPTLERDIVGEPTRTDMARALSGRVPKMPVLSAAILEAHRRYLQEIQDEEDLLAMGGFD